MLSPLIFSPFRHDTFFVNSDICLLGSHPEKGQTYKYRTSRFNIFLDSSSKDILSAVARRFTVNNIYPSCPDQVSGDHQLVTAFTMTTIAVAGGTGGVGSTIVDGLVEYGKHKVYVLSRTVRGPLRYLLHI